MKNALLNCLALLVIASPSYVRACEQGQQRQIERVVAHHYWVTYNGADKYDQRPSSPIYADDGCRLYPLHWGMNEQCRLEGFDVVCPITHAVIKQERTQSHGWPKVANN